MLSANNYYSFDIDCESGFRKLILKDFETEFITEKYKQINNSNVDMKRCSKCREILPSNTYFFNSGGKVLHRYCKTCEGSPRYGWGRIKNKEFNLNGYHYCSKCDRALPLNEIYFTKSSGVCNKQTGYSSNCKECNGNPFGLNNINSNIIEVKENYKICTSCLLELPQSKIYFFDRTEYKDALQSICKKCKGFEYGMYRINRSIKIDGYKYCNRCKKWYPRNEYFFKVNDTYCKQCQSYIGNHGKLDRYHYIRDYWFDVLEYFMDSNGYVHCAYCGEIVLNPDLEHVIPDSKGGRYTVDNIVPAGGISECACNQSKNNMDLDDFFIKGGRNNTFTKERYENILNFIKINSALHQVDCV